MTTLHLPPTMRVLERGWLSSNNILFLGREQTALVDSGYLSHAVQTVALVAHGLQGRPLDRLLNTHLHSDHCGGNAALQQAYSCHTSIPAGQAEQVRSWDRDALSYNGTGQQCAPFSFDDTLQAGDLLTLGDMQWEVMAAAGHDPHSLIFYCQEHGILISADALWENGFGVIFPELDGESGFAEARATLELIATLDVRLVIPGHGSPFSGVAAALDTAFSRLDYLAADPQRNAQNAIKVLLKFLLLERQQIELTEVPPMLATMPLVAAANRRYLQRTEADLSEWAIAQLVRAGAAEIRDGFLYNRH
ncbi:Glyoxylase, beta-lactamase superfamily II [Collimonas sp. OK607]|uniref:MBL fold metallo-hydrolase n=1 Tax=Collimonas sp. OK607 TaxID=1798194 RepID=UPI0008F00A42|nr:MBL fold metallo-hydrolase [Collimonas sp. OK607]SFB37264.1 Glyoxylase, beta-lactamase superfamily II [Collimonas sp. OK607]